MGRNKLVVWPAPFTQSLINAQSLLFAHVLLCALQLFAMTALYHFAQGPRLPHQPDDSPWASENVWRNTKAYVGAAFTSCLCLRLVCLPPLLLLLLLHLSLSPFSCWIAAR